MTGLRLYAALAAAVFALAVGSAQAQQENLPQLPDPIRNLVDDGAQIRYLGRDHGFDGWMVIKGGQQQYFYVLPDRSAFLTGILLDSTGKAVTLQQVRKLQGDPLLESLAGTDEFSTELQSQQDDYALKSPSEQLFHDIENSNWVPLGQAGAPVLYSFIDPQCPHCHAFIEDLMSNDDLQSGRVQLRMIPVGFTEETRAQAAFLMATPNPQERWLRYLGGETDALPARSDINQQGVQRNLAIMQSWKFNVTPMIVYRGKDGTVKIVRGRAKDVPGLLADIGSRN